MGLLTPDRYVADLTVVNLDDLWAQGKRALLLDRDNTVVPRDTGEVPPEIAAWIARARDRGFKVCFVSNNSARNVQPDADRLGCGLVARAAKPLPFALWRTLRRLGVPRSQAVLMGDQVFTDLLAGKLAGIDTVLVAPLCEVELEHSLALRGLEARVLKGRVPEGHGPETPPQPGKA